jgi:hypothetical protein
MGNMSNISSTSILLQLPGLNHQRLLYLMRAAIDRCGLDLSGYTVFTEAASGAYLTTPIISAMAGADHVYALTRSTRYGSAEEIAASTLSLARLAGVEKHVEVILEKSQETVSKADIVTNSGHVRPIDSEMIAWMKPTAVIPLMYEDWELRPSDIDLVACRKRGIRITGTNERHGAVDVFSFLGIMAVKLLLDTGVAVYSSHVLLLCDNPFAPYIERGLAAAGAVVECVHSLADAREDIPYDAILVALTPTAQSALSEADIAKIAGYWPGSVVAIYWGDVDRTLLEVAGLSFWPPAAAPLGHMGILPSGVGPEPIIRLQVGSLKAAEAMLRYSLAPNHSAHEFGQPL